MTEPATDANGASSKAVDDLLTRSDAIALAGVHATTFARWQREGRVVPIIRNGRSMYDPKEVEGAKDSDREDTNIVSELRKIIADQAEAIHKLLDSVTKPAEVFTGQLNALFARLAEKDEKHETRWLEVLKLSEEMISEQHSRSIAIKEWEAGEKRKDELLELAKKIGPSIVDTAILGKFRSFLSKLGPERLGFLLDKETDFLSPELRRDLAEMLVALQKTENLKGKTDEPSERKAGDGKEGEPGRPARSGDEGGGGPGSGQHGADRGGEKAPQADG
jgi:DNA-binding transcriptional MerR regulator